MEISREIITEETSQKTMRYIRSYELVSSDNERARTYYHYAVDELGSITHVVNGTVPRIENVYEYDSFGNTIYGEEGIHSRFRFTGQQYDPLTGLYYLRSRFYNPVTARFTQEDSYYGDGLNLYAYCRNNPVNYYDPEGHAKCPVEAGKKALKQLKNDKKTDFYVTPNGEIIPSTGYRYISENAPYLKDMTNSMTIPANVNGTYFSFNNYSIANPGALQVPHDASVKVSFDTLQIIDDINIPFGNWGKAPYLELITKDFPQFGSGGATQVITHSKIEIDSITKLPKK